MNPLNNNRVPANGTKLKFLEVLIIIIVVLYCFQVKAQPAAGSEQEVEGYDPEELQHAEEDQGASASKPAGSDEPSEDNIIRGQRMRRQYEVNHNTSVNTGQAASDFGVFVTWSLCSTSSSSVAETVCSPAHHDTQSPDTHNIQNTSSIPEAQGPDPTTEAENPTNVLVDLEHVGDDSCHAALNQDALSSAAMSTSLSGEVDETSAATTGGTGTVFDPGEGDGHQYVSTNEASSVSDTLVPINLSHNVNDPVISAGGSTGSAVHFVPDEDCAHHTHTHEASVPDTLVQPAADASSPDPDLTDPKHTNLGTVLATGESDFYQASLALEHQVDAEAENCFDGGDHIEANSCHEMGTCGCTHHSSLQTENSCTPVASAPVTSASVANVSVANASAPIASASVASASVANASAPIANAPVASASVADEDGAALQQKDEGQAVGHGVGVPITPVQETGSPNEDTQDSSSQACVALDCNTVGADSSSHQEDVEGEVAVEDNDQCNAFQSQDENGYYSHMGYIDLALQRRSRNGNLTWGHRNDVDHMDDDHAQGKASSHLQTSLNEEDFNLGPLASFTDDDEQCDENIHGHFVDLTEQRRLREYFRHRLSSDQAADKEKDESTAEENSPEAHPYQNYMPDDKMYEEDDNNNSTTIPQTAVLEPSVSEPDGQEGPEAADKEEDGHGADEKLPEFGVKEENAHQHVYGHPSHSGATTHSLAVAPSGTDVHNVDDSVLYPQQAEPDNHADIDIHHYHHHHQDHTVQYPQQAEPDSHADIDIHHHHQDHTVQYPQQAEPDNHADIDIHHHYHQDHTVQYPQQAEPDNHADIDIHHYHHHHQDHTVQYPQQAEPDNHADIDIHHYHHHHEDHTVQHPQQAEPDNHADIDIHHYHHHHHQEHTAQYPQQAEPDNHADIDIHHYHHHHEDHTVQYPQQAEPDNHADIDIHHHHHQDHTVQYPQQAEPDNHADIDIHHYHQDHTVQYPQQAEPDNHADIDIHHHHHQDHTGQDNMQAEPEQIG